MKLLEHLAEKFAGSPEDWATESLYHVVSGSETAKNAFLEFLTQAEIAIPEQIHFETQSVNDDESRPDLVGKDAENQTPLIVESKFWAGLTSNQPVQYLNNLPEDRDGLLTVISPSKRVPTLWDELLYHCKQAGYDVSDSKEVSSNARHLPLTSTKHLLLCSWDTIISSLEMRLAGNNSSVDDLQQLKALCQKMDTEAFLPLKQEELTKATPRRIGQYIELIGEIVDRLKLQESVSTEGLQWAHSDLYHRRYVRIHGYGAFLALDYLAWSDLRDTPLWLGIKGKSFSDNTTELKDLLSTLTHKNPSEVIDPEWDHDHYLRAPLVPPVQVEKEQVIRSVIDQIDSVISLVAHSAEKE